MAKKISHQKWLEMVAAKDGYCSAKTRRGTPCRRKDLYHSGRCRLHGGLSSGPRSSEGKSRSSKNGKLGGRPKKAKSMRG